MMRKSTIKASSQLKENYLFGPFIGESVYELNYYVGHAIYLRKKNPKNRIIVLTRKEHFDLYGRYATTLIPLKLEDGLQPHKFGCKNIRLGVYDEIVRKFKFRFKDIMKIHEHFYPNISTYLRNVKWNYPRNEVNFDFRTRPKNSDIAKEFGGDNIIVSEFYKETETTDKYKIVPYRHIKKINIDYKESSILGVLIELIRNSRYVHADIDSVIGRLAMLMKKPLITHRDQLDSYYLNPINPYRSIVIGCSELNEGIEYLEEKYGTDYRL